jgi:hypothetical protein
LGSADATGPRLIARSTRPSCLRRSTVCAIDPFQTSSITLINKPFQLHELTRRVREVLDTARLTLAERRK